MQQRHMDAETPIASTRHRLQQGFFAFRKDFGKTIRKARESEFRFQKALAHAMGVSRETVSRIENGAVPRPDTLDRLLSCLGLELGDIALPGSSDRPTRQFDGSWRGEVLVDLGKDLRRGRLAEELSLRDLSQRLVEARTSTDRKGLSAAQLSRIEHGEATRSRVLEDHPDDTEDPPGDRRVRFMDQELQRLADLGRRLR